MISTNSDNFSQNYWEEILKSGVVWGNFELQNGPILSNIVSEGGWYKDFPQTPRLVP